MAGGSLLGEDWGVVLHSVFVLLVVCILCLVREVWLDGKKVERKEDVRLE